MISKASVNFVRIAPRKVRYVIDLLRKKTVPQAHAILNGSPRRAADIIRKLLNQAVDAAEKNAHANPADLFVSKILADGGPSMRRFRAATMGRANRIKKRTSHIQLELDMKKGVTIAPAAKPAAKTVVKKAPAAASSAKKPAKTATKKLVGAK